MSIQNLLINEQKSYMNIRVQNIIVDDEIIASNQIISNITVQNDLTVNDNLIVLGPAQLNGVTSSYINNYGNIQTDTLTLGDQGATGAASLNEYLEGNFNWNWEAYTTGGTAQGVTGALPMSYTKCGKNTTLLMKNDQVTLGATGYIQFEGLPESLNPKYFENRDIVQFPVSYLQVVGNYPINTDMRLTIEGPTYGSPLANVAYLSSNEAIGDGLATGNYVIQQQTFTYLTEN